MCSWDDAKRERTKQPYDGTFFIMPSDTVQTEATARTDFIWNWKIPLAEPDNNR